MYNATLLNRNSTGSKKKFIWLKQVHNVFLCLNSDPTECHFVQFIVDVLVLCSNIFQIQVSYIDLIVGFDNTQSKISLLVYAV